MFLTNIIAYAIIIGRFKMVAEKYPRGRRGSPAKGVVREKRSQGSNPCFSAKKPNPITRVGFLLVEKGFPRTLIRGGKAVNPGRQADARFVSLANKQIPASPPKSPARKYGLGFSL